MVAVRDKRKQDYLGEETRAIIPNLLQTLKIVTELDVETVGGDLCALSVLDIFSSVHEPCGDLVISRVLDDVDQVINLSLGKFSGTLFEIDVSLLAAEGGKTTTDTSNASHGERNLLASIDVGTQNTQNVRKILLIHDHRLRVHRVSPKKTKRKQERCE